MVVNSITGKPYTLVKNQDSPSKDVNDTSTPPPLSDPAIDNQLAKAWDHYKKFMIAQDGRPLCERDSVDIDGDGDTQEFQTFSEGVSYVLLRAVMMNDKETFDKVWQWAHDNLQRNNLQEVYHWNTGKFETPSTKDNLFAWRYLDNVKEGKSAVIRYDFESPDEQWRDGFDAASDADQDIAAALLLANKKWGSGEGNLDYLSRAKDILSDMWEKDPLFP